MTTRVIRKLASMDRREAAFRAASAGRRAAQRAATLIARPRWDRAGLLARLAPGVSSPAMTQARRSLERLDWTAAHAALVDHFRHHSPILSARIRSIDRAVDAIRRHRPDAKSDARERAAGMLDGHYDLLGYESLAFGSPPDWHLDPVSGRRSPQAFWADVPYLDPASGDHKVTWELNRHQHWLRLGRAARLTGDRVWYDRFVFELESWLENNPPLTGTNWASMLELAFRSLSWVWSASLFLPVAGASDRLPWLVDLLVGIERQLGHVSNNLSRYFSPNTHLTGEALAVYVAGRTLPELSAAARWTIVGRDVLLEEIERQIRPDGGHVEQSGHYHRYSTDFYLLALLVARESGDSAAVAFERAARRQANFLREICDDRGRRPFTGDDDGGQLFPICGRASDDCRDTLWNASVLLNDPALAIGEIPEETYWFTGQVDFASAHGSSHRGSRVLGDSGYFVSRTPAGDHLLFDTGPHGFLNGGHAHADALSVSLTVRNRPLLVDPGTATYTMDRAQRDRFRSTAMHNTVVIDGRPQSTPVGPFHWKRATDGRALVAAIGPGCEYFEGTHDAYAPRRHTRTVLAIHQHAWIIIDWILGAGHATADAHWHFAPEWQAGPLDPHSLELRATEARYVMAASAPIRLLTPDDPEGLTQVSTAYGRIERAATARQSVAGALPQAIVTVVGAGPARVSELRVGTDGLKEPGWTALACTIHWPRYEVRLLTATTNDGRHISAPRSLWGTGPLRTNGRAALIITPCEGRPEGIVVNGRTLESDQGGLAWNEVMPLRRAVLDVSCHVRAC
jgi:hypothetical protein